VTSDGGVRCWGEGAVGQLGYGDTENVGLENTPADKGDVELEGAATQLFAGDRHSCAIETAGLRCWGDNRNGQLGYGHTDNIGDTEAPADAGDVPIGEQVIDLALGGEHTCAIVDGGRVRCWGNGEHGQLGYGNSESIHDAANAPDVPVMGP
jgi:alpha-tubulin suppressor-like RCC1 family protein